ncbi:hypothetical protein GWK47_018676 [Chionoecetes opilio]|uniref:Uncharacterized protein n=1 Tax=Chionoecetes opilio TaxID=41210 RepID=A0A8J5CGC9_CHIOP|nr:hypothetical protein GWK47_018676 [Chionoecetes opilio]
MATDRLQLPSFHYNVQDWLLHVQGYLVNTSAKDQQKFNAVVYALPTEVATLVQSTITWPPDYNRFAALKSALLDVYRRPVHHHLHELQTITLGDMMPFILWQQLQLINIRCNTSLPTAVLRSINVPKMDLQPTRECRHACPPEAPPPYMGSLMSGDTTEDQHVCAARLPRAETSGTPLRQILQRLDAIEERMNIRVSPVCST